MVASNSRLSYGDCFDLMDKAIDDQKGIAIRFGTSAEAWHFRIRLHTARRIDRTDNMETYEQGHPMYGRSAYDPLTMRIREKNGEVWLRMEKVNAREFEVTSLSKESPEPQLDFKPTPPPQRIVEKILEVKPLRRRV